MLANCMIFHTQIASIMEVLANAAVAEVCKLVDDDYAVFRLEITQSQKENSALRRKLQLLELKMARERVLASRSSSVKIIDRYRGMAKGEGHLTGGHRSFVKPTGHNTWRDDQPITVNEGSGTSTQHVVMIESANAEAAGHGVKLERSEGDEDPRHSRDIQTGAAHGVAPPVATEDLTAASQARTRCSITEVSGTPNAILKTETETETLTVTQRLLHTGPNHRSDSERLGCVPAPGSEYLPVFHQSQGTVNSCGDGDGDALDTGVDDPSCSYTTEMNPGNMPLGLETQTDLSRGDWNRYSSSVYSEGCLDKKGEVIVIDEVTVKVEGDAPPTWNADSHLGDGHSQGRDFLDYRGNLNVATHSPLHTFRDCDPVSTSMAPSDSHGRVIFDQVLHLNDRAIAQARGGGATTVGKEKLANWNADETHLGEGHSQGNTSDFLDYRESLETNLNVATHSPLHPVSTSMAPSDSHGQVLFDQVLNSKDQRAKARRGQATPGGKEKRFLCMFCNKGFSCSQKVEIHQRVHTGEKPFSCTQCHMCFTHAGNLKRHQRVHTGEKPFSCAQCHMRFAQTGDLKRHQRVHTGERPFTCTHCGKKFSERSYLRIHQQKNHSTL
ncbi:oocyte zinc finger protein XlCOF29-like isoform X1 [Salmo salar]|uniref:Oocyte zinc finger protein XlCOF29-like isoform X1 n=1 Tax=Salmo salar TaxID=8030 RepID=A0A1S3RFC9_SALSA|nr:oocyte zinc finger protein XlCOF29-like isoform X1 [Salmo salar]